LILARGLAGTARRCTPAMGRQEQQEGRQE